MQALPAGFSNFRISRNFRYRFGPPSKVSAGGIRQFPPVSAGRGGAKPANQAFADALDIVDKSDALENARGFPPFPVFPPVCVEAGETCERWNMLRSSGRDGREEICALLK
jgi:hypothetical protein